MMHLRPLATLLVLTLVPVASLQAAEPVPGLWSLSVTTTAEGAEGVYGPYTRQQCLTEEDIRNPEKLLAENGVDSCTYGDRVYQGGNFNFTVSCGGAIPMSGSGHIQYTASSLKGSMQIAANLQGLPINTHSEVSGNRLGDCSR